MDVKGGQYTRKKKITWAASLLSLGSAEHVNHCRLADARCVAYTKLRQYDIGDTAAYMQFAAERWQFTLWLLHGTTPLCLLLLIVVADVPS